MKNCCRLATALLLTSTVTLHAELHEMLKPTSEQFERDMKTYDKNVALQIKGARDGYLRVLAGERVRAERAKRSQQVAAIDTEIATLKAGKSLSEKAPANLPTQLSNFRDRCAGTPERATKSTEPVRRHARDNYLNWLGGMAAQAKRGKSAELEAAVAGEKKRVLGKYPDPKPEKTSGKKPPEKSKAKE